MTLILSGTDSSVSSPAVQGGTGGTTTGLYYPATNQLALATNGTQAVLVDSSQNVGIGNSSPQAKLSVGAGTTAPGYGYAAKMVYVCDTSQPEVLVRETTGSVVTSMYADSSTGNLRTATNHPLAFATNNAERMRIDTSGRVIVGYTASVGTAYQTNIQVKGNSASGYAGYGVTTSNNESAGLFGAYSNGENSLWIASDPDSLRAGSRIVFTVDGTQVVSQINPFGIGVGTATPTSGTGITFPATQSASSDANTLDDYEEGTWSPKVTFGGSDSSGQTGTFAGFYTKTGNQVFATALINLTNKGSATGTMGIGGLPFTSSSSSNYRAVSSSMNWDTLATSYVYMYALLSVGGTNMEVLGITAAAASNGTNPTQANINNNSNFRISITYQV